MAQKSGTRGVMVRGANTVELARSPSLGDGGASSVNWTTTVLSSREYPCARNEISARVTRSGEWTKRRVLERVEEAVGVKRFRIMEPAR